MAASSLKGKNDLRKMFLKKLKTQKEVDRLRKSSLIKKKLFSSQAYKKAKTILFYASFDREVETREMLRQALKEGKEVILPVIMEEQKSIIPSRVFDLDKELGVGPYGIMQPLRDYLRPIALSDINLVIVPGVAFDKAGERLGRGKGYYDRFLKKLPATTPTIGLAFDFQIQKSLPFVSSSDVAVKKVIVS